MPELRLRPATAADVPRLRAHIEESARGLSAGFYSPAQVEGALRHVFGVDTQLVADGTYFVIEADGEIAAAGGWSARRTLHGGDQARTRDDARLDPATDPARIRAFFVRPAWARRGLARRLFEACEAAAGAAGFTSFELMATMPGVPLYTALGFVPHERVEVPLDGDEVLPCIRMTRPIAAATGGGRRIAVRPARPEEHAALRELTLQAYAELEAVMTPSAWAGLDGAVRGTLDAEGRALASRGAGGPPESHDRAGSVGDHHRTTADGGAAWPADAAPAGSAFSAERFVAEVEGEVVGTVLLFPPAADAYAGAIDRARWPEVRLLAVAPRWRGSGAAQALMDACVRRAREMGATALGLHTSRSLAAAVRLYRRMGFVRAPEHDFQPAGAEVVEGYRLDLR